MGELKRFRLNDFNEAYDLKVFVETGTSDGKGVSTAKQYNFEKIFSIEIVPEQAKKMSDFFQHDKRIEIITGDSVSSLAKLLPTIKENCFIYLDAHYRGADCGYGRHDDPDDEDIRLPLEKELLLIKALRPNAKDVIVMDDIRIYADQGAHCWREDIKPRKKFSSDRFFIEILAETHNYQIILEDTGYCVLTPK